MSEFFLDTSALVEFFEGTELGATVCAMVEEGSAATNHISIAEFSDICARKGVPCKEQATFLQQYVRVLPLSIESCIRAGTLKTRRRKARPAFGIVDALLYLTAREHELVFVTKDADLKGMDHVMMLE